MPRNRKYFPHGQVLFITTRTEQGLPIVPNQYVNFLIWGILARAQAIHNVRICHFLFMSNHLHIIMVIKDPQAISGFMCSIKTEIAHAINKLLGRRQRTIWQDGYDSPLVLDTDKVIEKIKYIYHNPTNAKMVHGIDEYPGVSSWNMFLNEHTTKECLKVPRKMITKLSSPKLSISKARTIVKDLKEQNLIKYDFVLEPDAWRKALNAGIDVPTNEKIIAEIREEQEALRIERIRSKENVSNSTKLQRQSMLKDYAPEKFSPRMICLCSDRDTRKAFIHHFKTLVDIAKDIYQAWKKGEYHLKMPLGLFCPRPPEHASALLM